MVINPTYLAQTSRSSTNWQAARRRVLKSYRAWLRAVRPSALSPSSIKWPTRMLIVFPLGGTQAPEIQQMYSLNMPVSRIRTKVRSEFEKHRYVNQLDVVDVLLFQSHSEFQETLNYWKQLAHVMKYFTAEENPRARLPKDFISGFLEGRN
ncbi:hypothetical protein EPUS_04003 [Endocarpon pusillum Z07020]|uniref:NADH-ubiquinone oxidoreductase 14.8 kDa subunit n=1 Tax=Endocarpon pusillum (strain Z07020 / HMAS-L-300199) TaxID=1263415 RepID=U1GB93_ENDPU|nr:uncharacterized protein EPUS_04003 [Endocarpon pusillum Z07020]ERF69298.1 hypothetical protein EPUS_04003 [Endocarpon pusillum Z07020]